jgi:uncharacterized protein
VATSCPSRAVPRDPARGLQLHEKACEGGHLESCRSAGVLLDRTPRITPDPARARSFFERACDGNAAVCGNLAVQAERQDKDRARALYVRACDMGNVLACRNGAQFLTWARSDPPQRLRLLEKGCAFGGGSMAATACTTLASEHDTRPWLLGELARLYAEGKGVPRDTARPHHLRVKAADTTRELCVLSLDADSCFSLAWMYEKGEGVDASASQAIVSYARACQARHEVARGTTIFRPSATRCMFSYWPLHSSENPGGSFTAFATALFASST